MTERDPSTKRSTKFRSAAVIFAVAISGAVLAACGSGAASSASSSTTTTTTSGSGSAGSSTSASNTAFTSCLKQHGVSSSGLGSGFGHGAPGSTGGTKPAAGTAINSKMRSALQACASLRPKGSGFGGFGVAGGASGASSTAVAAFRNCMTLHGVTLPKAGSGGAPGANSALTSTASYKSAFKACSSLLPTKPTTTPST
jgi:hypothetical protein